MGWVESLQQAIDYMENNLLDDISIENVAKEANVSVFHFQRIFMVLTDITVGDYIRRRRLTLAAQELSHSNCKVIDLAYKYGYETPEAFTKAFRRQHGITPSEVRKFQGKLTSYNRLMIQVNLKGAEPMNYRIVERDAFQVIGLKREYSTANGENHIGIPQFWNEINANGTDQELFSLNNGQIKGVLGVCVDTSSTGSETIIDYWIATEHVGEEIPSTFEKMEIPAAKWAVFEVIGAMPDAMPKAWKKIFSEWFPSSHYKPANSPQLEVYSDEDPTKPDLYSEIWIPVK